MTTKEYISSGILEAYLLGALTAEEQLQVEAEIAKNPELADELRAIETTMQQYTATHAQEPPADMQEKIWSAIQASAATDAKAPPRIIPFQPEYRKPMAWKYAAMWIGLAGSLIANGLFMVHSMQERDARVAMVQKIDQLQNQQNALVGLITDYEKATNMMADTGMQTVVMHTVLKGHPMAATLYWSKDKGIAYVAMDALPQPPKGMQYQLWVIQDGKPVDMGVLPNRMANTPELQKVDKQVMTGEVFAISLEKEGGSPTPTMQNIYVMGKPS